MARATLATIISRVRDLIGDTGVGQVLNDDSIQAALDASRIDWFNLELHAEPTYSPGSDTPSYASFYSPVGGDWEDDITFQRRDHTTLIAGSGENQVGRWLFSSPLGQADLPVTCTGKTFDPYRAGAELLYEIAGGEKGQYDFTSDGHTVGRQSASLGQKFANPLALAGRLMSQSKPVRVRLTRGGR